MKVLKNNIVFIISAAIILLIVLWGGIFPQDMRESMSTLLTDVINSFGWFYVLSVTVFVAFCFYIGFGPYRHMVLGDDDDKPEYSYFAWIGMLFAAGMGVGLVFWGVAEPLSHFAEPPEGIEPGTQEASETGLLFGVFHWGFHPWAVYAVVALGLAIAKFRKKLPGLISSAFHPLIGDRVHGPIGKAIDVTAIVGTSVGIATSFGLSTLQMSGGINILTGIEDGPLLQISIIAVITAIFITSVITGINKGMKYLSVTNLAIAGLLMAVVFILGPTLFLMEHFTKTVGSYISQFVSLSFYTTPYSDNEWIGNWTFFYWAWIISWSPFVGTFIARVSKGRTVQEFIIGVLFVPTIVTIFWFVGFGGTALNYEITGVTDMAGQVLEEPESGLFLLLSELPAGMILSTIGLLLITIFFITSANSATYVLGVFSSKGDLEPKNKILIIWGLLISSVAAVLLIAGGLDGLQAIAIIGALPFTFIIIAMMGAIYRNLKREGLRKHKVEEEEDW